MGYSDLRFCKGFGRKNFLKLINTFHPIYQHILPHFWRVINNKKRVVNSEKVYVYNRKKWLFTVPLCYGLTESLLRVFVLMRHCEEHSDAAISKQMCGNLPLLMVRSQEII